MCEHLIELENDLKLIDIKETSRGEAWSANCREWVYYDCYLKTENIITRLKLPDFVVATSNDDPRSGLEEGLYCEKCEDAIMGYHRILDGKRNVKIVS